MTVDGHIDNTRHKTRAYSTRWVAVRGPPRFVIVQSSSHPSLTFQKIGQPPDPMNHPESDGGVGAVRAFQIAHASVSTDLS